MRILDIIKYGSPIHVHIYFQPIEGVRYYITLDKEYNDQIGFCYIKDYDNVRRDWVFYNLYFCSDGKWHPNGDEKAPYFFDSKTEMIKLLKKYHPEAIISEGC
jgi:hypothetical protein